MTSQISIEQLQETLLKAGLHYAITDFDGNSTNENGNSTNEK